MPTVDVLPHVFDQLSLLARAWDVSRGEAVERLLADYSAAASAHDEEPSVATAVEVPVHAVYEGTRVRAIYNRITKAVRVLEGKHQGETFKSPSGAAIAVVSAINPKVNPNRNGWSFWVVSGSGDLLQTLRKDDGAGRG